IEVEDLTFGERSKVLLDPAEERIKSEFEGVKCTMLPMHSILRIDEVKKQGVSKITTLEGGNVAQFPMGIYQPSGSEPGKRYIGTRHPAARARRRPDAAVRLRHPGFKNSRASSCPGAGSQGVGG